MPIVISGKRIQLAGDYFPGSQQNIRAVIMCSNIRVPIILLYIVNDINQECGKVFTIYNRDSLAFDILRSEHQKNKIELIFCCNGQLLHYFQTDSPDQLSAGTD